MYSGFIYAIVSTLSPECVLIHSIRIEYRYDYKREGTAPLQTGEVTLHTFQEGM
ncbi:hypothetical protein QY97_01815 [Bacillus thermotolerans]|uniref:Uncharacterized protein n=1 Tax=Bacillus thermotolerans TaxID=1221996 RepID=A0A0F5I8D2_BACTR|nr:hypothetical protein QY97_01815 [Bacillus thermotolerans]KKB41452.1 hypothetical protein QY95_00771 [Bacillus thermotolerans]KKB44003.1 hypothetical protein QY96_00195 [Bacillus thermotolerans]